MKWKFSKNLENLIVLILFNEIIYQVAYPESHEILWQRKTGPAVPKMLQDLQNLQGIDTSCAIGSFEGALNVLLPRMWQDVQVFL